MFVFNSMTTCDMHAIPVSQAKTGEERSDSIDDEEVDEVGELGGLEKRVKGKKAKKQAELYRKKAAMEKLVAEVAGSGVRMCTKLLRFMNLYLWVRVYVCVVTITCGVVTINNRALQKRF